MNELLRQEKRELEDESIDLGPLLVTLGKAWYILLLSAILFGALIWFGSHVFLTPTYKTNCRVYVNNMLDSSEKTSVTSSDLTAARSLANTYAEIIRGRTVLEEAARRLELPYTYTQLSKMVTVTTSSSSEIITISVETTSPETSRNLCNSIVEVAQAQVASIVDGSSMRVIDQPFLPLNINSPNYRRNAAIGACLGILLAAGVILLRTLVDNRIRDEETLESRFGIVILGSIPSFEEAHKSGGHYSYGYGKASSEVKV